MLKVQKKVYAVYWHFKMFAKWLTRERKRNTDFNKVKGENNKFLSEFSPYAKILSLPEIINSNVRTKKIWISWENVCETYL